MAKNIQKKIEKESSDRVYANKSELDLRIASVASATIDYYIDNVFPEVYDIIKQKVLFSADVEYQIKKLTGESNLTHKIYPLIDSTHDTFVTNLYDVETTPVIIPRIAEAIPLKNEAEMFYDWAESVSGIASEERLIEYEASLIGTSYGKFGTMNDSVYEVSSLDVELKDQKPTVTEIPNCSHVSFFELFCEPGCVNFYNSRFKIRRNIFTLTQILELYPFIDFNQKRETLNDKDVDLKTFIEKTSGSCLYGWDFNRIWQIRDYENTYKTRCLEKNLERDIFNAELYSDIFSVIRGENGKNEVIEYLDPHNGNLVVMVNTYVIYDGDSPYANIDPYGVVVYERQPGTYRGRGVGQKLMSLQKEANMLFSSVNNGIKMHLFPDYAITKGSLKTVGGGDVTNMKWQGGAVYEVPVGNAITSEPFKAIHFVDKDVLQLARNRLQEIRMEAQEIVGTNSYTQGGQGKVERSASAVSARVATLRVRLNPIVESLNNFRQRSFYVWMYIAAIQYPDALIVRIVNKDNKEDVKFLKIKPSELLNKFEILIDRETAVSIRRAEAVTNTIQILNALNPYLVDQNGLPTIDVRDTIKKMLSSSLLQNVNVLDEQGVKDLIDMKLNVDSYVQSKLPQQGPAMPTGADGGMPTEEDIAAAASQIPDRGIDATPEQLAALGMA